MNKGESIAALAEATGLSKKDVKNFCDEAATLITKAAKKDDEFHLPGIAKFTKVSKKARTGRNPQTGKAVKIPARTQVKARIDNGLKKSIS